MAGSLDRERLYRVEKPTDLRIVDYAIGLFPEIPTKNAVKKAIRNELLYINDEVATTANWIKVGDCIVLKEDLQTFPKSYPMDVEIVFEDNWLVVVNKPSGIPVSGNAYRTLENALVGKTKLSSEIDAYNWSKPVHRLDAATSGLVLFAKTATVNRALRKRFEDKRIEKKYHAVVQGLVETEMIIDIPIEGKVSKSILKCIQSVHSLQNEILSLVELSPETGRTHQLRIHCKQMGFPIVGDKLYGNEGNIMKHKGLFLCAVRLEFEHPVSAEHLIIEVPTPDKFKALLDREERRWNKFKAT